MRHIKFGFDWPTVSEEKIFEIVDGRMPDHGHLISSPNEPNGSCKLNTQAFSCRIACAGVINFQTS